MELIFDVQTTDATNPRLPIFNLGLINPNPRNLLLSSSLINSSLDLSLLSVLFLVSLNLILIGESPLS